MHKLENSPQNSSSTRLESLRNIDDIEFMKSVEIDLKDLETIRQEKLDSFIRRKKISIPIATILTPICIWIDGWLLILSTNSDDSGAGITFMLLGGLYWWTTAPKRQYAKSYKKNILPKLAKTLGLFYSGTKKIPIDIMRRTKIVPSHDRYTSDDYFEGQYKGVNIQFSEIKLQEKRRSNKRTYYATVFKGVAVLLEMEKKNFYGHTIMLQDQKKLFEWFKEKSTGLDRAHLVDPEFEKAFDVYTNDQTEARYLIDPAMIEDLKSLYAEYDGKKMMAAYFENKMLILIASKHNHFEPADIYVKATDPASIRNMKQEIIKILSVIDTLKLFDPMAWQEENREKDHGTLPDSLPGPLPSDTKSTI